MTLISYVVSIADFMPSWVGGCVALVMVVTLLDEQFCRCLLNVHWGEVNIGGIHLI